MKSYTDLEQSKKLAEFLPLKSADMSYQKEFITTSLFGEPIYDYKVKSDYCKWSNLCESIPCWSLAALRNLLPTAIKPNKDIYLFESHNTFDNSWVYRYYNEDDTSYLYCKNTNEVDACFEMIIKLNELNLL